MATSLAVAIQSAKFITDSLGAVLKLKLDAETLLRVNEAFGRVAEVQSGLLEAQQQLMEQHEHIRQLRRQLESFDTWQQRSNNYELVKTPGGAIVWKSLSGLEHHACPQCFEDRKLSILQDGGSRYSGTWHCQACDKPYRLDVPEPININPTRFG